MCYVHAASIVFAKPLKDKSCKLCLIVGNWKLRGILYASWSTLFQTHDTLWLVNWCLCFDIFMVHEGMEWTFRESLPSEPWVISYSSESWLNFFGLIVDLRFFCATSNCKYASLKWMAVNNRPPAIDIWWTSSTNALLRVTWKSPHTVITPPPLFTFTVGVTNQLKCRSDQIFKELNFQQVCLVYYTLIYLK